MGYASGSRQRRLFASVAFTCLLFLVVACGGNPTPQTIIVRIYEDTPVPSKPDFKQRDRYRDRVASRHL